jgi:MFS family permease
MLFKSRIYWSWLLVSLFFLYQYILRLAPGVMCDPIRDTFGMTASDFSLLGAYYLYAYAIMQIPLGILLDRMGVRKIVLVAILLCLLGTLMMTHAQTIFWAQMSRILVGIGSAAAFMSAFKIAADGFPKGKQGFFMGMTVTMGTVGAFLGTKLLVWTMNEFGWRLGLDFVNCMGVVVWAGCFVCIPKGVVALTKPVVEDTGFWPPIIAVLKKWQVWLYAFLAMGMYGPVSTLANLWGTSFLMTKFTWDISKSAQLTALMHLGIAAGCFLIPWLTSKYNCITRGIRWSGFSLTLLFVVLIYVGGLSELTVILCLIGLGAFAGAEVICFSGVTRGTTSQNSGVTIGVVNSMDMFGGALLQQGVGSILEFCWKDGFNAAGTKIYALEHYQWALSSLIAITALSWVLSFLLPRDAVTAKA